VASTEEPVKGNSMASENSGDSTVFLPRPEIPAEVPPEIDETSTNRRVDFDTTVVAMALTAKDMNTKYKERSKGGLAVLLVVC
jgi:hypothetical protein